MGQITKLVLPIELEPVVEPEVGRTSLAEPWNPIPNSYSQPTEFDSALEREREPKPQSESE